MTRVQLKAATVAARVAALRRDRDALRTSLEYAVEDMAETLNEAMRGYHPTLGDHPIRAELLRGPGEYDRETMLVRALEIHTNAGLALRLGIAPSTSQLLLEQAWLPDGRPRWPRLFDRIERLAGGRDALLTRGPRALSLLRVFDEIESYVLG